MGIRVSPARRNHAWVFALSAAVHGLVLMLVPLRWPGSVSDGESTAVDVVIHQRLSPPPSRLSPGPQAPAISEEDVARALAAASAPALPENFYLHSRAGRTFAIMAAGAPLPAVERLETTVDAAGTTRVVWHRTGGERVCFRLVTVDGGVGDAVELWQRERC